MNFPRLNEVKLRERLCAEGWSSGLQQALITGIYRCPIRFIIIDNSGSMMSNDGHLLTLQGHTAK